MTTITAWWPVLLDGPGKSSLCIHYAKARKSVPQGA